MMTEDELMCEAGERLGADVPAECGEAVAQREVGMTHADLEPQWASLADVYTNPPPPREWIIDQWLPQATLASLFGGGGTGKSTIIQQMAVCVATGQPFFGCAVKSGRALMFLAEDDNQEVRRRHRDICRSMGIDPASIADRP